MKKTIITSIIAVFLSVSVFAQGAGMRQMKNIDGKDYVAVTNPVTLVNTEAAARRAGDAGLTNYALTTATALVSAEATERIAGDSTSISFTSATSNALAAATASLVASEASARRAGDAASTNFTLSVSNSLNTSIVSLVNAEASARRAGDAASTNFTLSVSNSLSLSTSALVDTRVPTNRTITIGSQVGSLQTNLVFTSTGAGVTEPTVTNIAQAVASAYLPLSGGTMTGDITMGDRTIIGKRFGELSGIESSGNAWIAIGGGSGYFSSGDNWFSFGTLSGAYSTGNNWVAIGVESGQRISGSGWSSLGNYSGFFSSGDNWSAIGSYAGSRALGNNWASIGVYSGYNSRGDNRIYVDAYGGNPNYGENGATNDMIFGDNGYLYLGRGLGAPGGQQGGIFRGAWAFNDSLTLFGKTITWNSSRQTFDVPLYGGVVGQLFQENLMLVRNQTGENIGNGKIVCSAGSVGDNSAIRKASNADASCAWGVLGMVTQDAGIDHGSDGLICTGGEVNNLPLPTSIYQPSNTLWLATDGNYTNVEPQNVAVKYQIGTVLRAHATKGRIQFNPQFIPSPETLGALPTSHNTDETAHPGLRSIAKPIVFGTNVVRVVSTQSVYVATVTSPCVITQDVSALTLATNQTAFWTTRINVTDWSATNGITFATNIAAYAGDFTVTGCYDFACSLLCDGSIEMRQAFPTVYPWMKTPTSVAGGNTTSEICTFDRKALLTSADTSKSFVAEIPYITCPYIVRTLFYAGATSSWTNNVSFSAGLVWFGNSENGSALYSTNAISTNATNFKITYNYVPSITLQPTTSARLYFNATKTLLAGGINFFPVEYRQANENEIRAYNNGWRPQ